MLAGNILITGGTGFLGRGIMRRAAQEGWPVNFTVLSRDEKKQHECAAKFPKARYVLGDVTDYARLRWLLVGHDAVIHAAALKYIPEGEFNADECVRVNIDGARVLVDAARQSGIRNMVGISTDKAAQPVNIYGMTKAVMERLFSAAGYNTCRYGNVLGSTGSVVPVMQEQLKTMGCVTVTDPDMTRFWMSVDQAVDTIMRAFAGCVGSTTVPSPRSATMRDIAMAICESPDRIRIIGKRPGEKQHEDLISHYELFRTVSVDGYYEILPPGNEDYSHDLPTLNSKDAERLRHDELVEMIADASHV